MTTVGPRGLLSILAVLVVALFTAPQAGAVAPDRYPDRVTDQAGVLTEDQKSELSRRLLLFGLATSEEFRLVLVDSFDGRTGPEWASLAVANNVYPGNRNDPAPVFVWAVAVDTGEVVADGLAHGDDDLKEITGDLVEASSAPAAAGDWYGAADAALDAMWTNPWFALQVLGGFWGYALALLLLPVFLWWLRRRFRR